MLFSGRCINICRSHPFAHYVHVRTAHSVLCLTVLVQVVLNYSYAATSVSMVDTRIPLLVRSSTGMRDLEMCADL